MRPQTHPLFCALLFVAGCPSTQTTAPFIEDVQPEGDAASTTFRLKVLGRGFGLKSVEFNVSKREGTVETAQLSLQIERGGSVIKRIDSIEVESPRVLYAQVLLTDPLRTGNYGVVLFEGENEIAQKDEAFFVPDTSTTTPDGGTDDSGPLMKDATPGDGDVTGNVDAGDGGIPPDDDGGNPDADGPDADPPDGFTPDSGLGPFQGAYLFRQLISPTNTVLAPAGVTIQIPVPHAAMLSAGTSLTPGGADLAVYQGPDRLAHQWQDQFVVGTDQLVIVARLLRDLPIGGSAADPLVLYSGDTAANLDVTDNVFEFSERFVSPVDNTWFVAALWVHCNLDRPIERVLDPNTEPAGSYCAIDGSNSNPARSTISTRNQPTMLAAPGANLTYEMSFWQAGRTIDGAADILYFSYGPLLDDFDITIDPPLASYGGYVPNGTLTFLDTDNANRTVDGWRHPTNVIEWWLRTTLRFVPTIDNPSLHFRYVSTNANTSNNSASAVDDWWVRLALEPDFVPVLGPPERR